MSRQEAVALYREALKNGQKSYKKAVVQGRYPYLQVLDEILDDTMAAGQINLGVLNIPMEQIVGTKTQGRKNAFSADFLPLMPMDSEFCDKWLSLCESCMEEEIRDPIRCYEYLGRFYVQEGNKRVSVMKAMESDVISGVVIRVVPVWSEDPEVQSYYEFLQFYELSHLYEVRFTQSGSFTRLQAAMGFEPDHVWTEEERRSFLSGFVFFQNAFRKLGGEELSVTVSDALLVWLKLYSFSQLKAMSAAELQKSLRGIWADVKVLGQAEPITVQTAPDGEEKEPGFVSRFVSSVFSGQLTVAFINELEPEESPWIQAHMRGVRYLEEVMGNRIKLLICSGAGAADRAESAMEEAIAAGAQVIFTTTPPLIRACRKIAAKYPNIRILNCSLSMPYTGVRTYYGRVYEGKFLSGAIAGAMSRSDVLGYVASNPIFGVPAGINAFALGAKLTNPRARIKLRWSCLPGDPIKELIGEGIDFISTMDIPSPDCVDGGHGACMVAQDGSLELLASPYWNWGAFYVKLIGSILNGGWDALNANKNGHQAVSYWWGMASGVIGVKLSPSLPEGVQNLVQILQKGIHDGTVSPFHRTIRSQDGVLQNDGGQWLMPEEIMHMEWLCDTVDGSIPLFDELLPRSQNIVRLQGVYRDRIPPEKENVSL